MKRHKHEFEPLGEALFIINPLSSESIGRCKICGALHIAGKWYIEEEKVKGDRK